MAKRNQQRMVSLTPEQIKHTYTLEQQLIQLREEIHKAIECGADCLPHLNDLEIRLDQLKKLQQNYGQ